MNALFTNWMPTLGGILAAIGTCLKGNDDPLVNTIGEICSAVGLLLLGGSARQFNVTSEQAGAK